ncbi:MAG: hypothetical protein PHE24_05895 [Patescibacteria group bacterium]|nr:hypothetical protein [Patescibacteria group bacterium]
MKKMACAPAVVALFLLFDCAPNNSMAPVASSFPAGWPQSFAAVDSLFKLDSNRVGEVANFSDAWYARSPGRLDQLKLTVFVRDTNANGGLTDLTVCYRHGGFHPGPGDTFDTLYQEKSASGVGIEVRHIYALGSDKVNFFDIEVIRGQFQTMYLTPAYRGAFFDGKLIDSTGIDAVHICTRSNQRLDQWPLLILRGNYPALRSAGGVYKYRVYDPESGQMVNYGEMNL